MNKMKAFGFSGAIIASLGIALAASAPSHGQPMPSSVTIPGSFQSELGCSGDWQPDCALTHLSYEAEDDVWQGIFNIPAGGYEYKAALNDSWDENYGAHATLNGPNIPLSLSGLENVKFYYDHKTHWITDNDNSLIVTAPGSYQSELGCSGDWQPDCLRSWLQDPDADGLLVFSTTQIPAGFYEAKAAIAESWDVNYGEGGVQNGPNIPFVVPESGLLVRFTFDSNTNILDITVGRVPEPSTSLLLGAGALALMGLFRTHSSYLDS